MGKFYGKIGYGISEEIKPGTYKKRIVEREYFGDVTENIRRLQTSDNLNDNIVINNEISIISDPFADENFHLILYVEYAGVKWKVSSVRVKYPRLILTIGEVYNGK